MTRFSITSRATLAKNALDAFLRHDYAGRSTSELHPSELRDAIADLVADIGHYTDRRFRNRTPFTELVARGVGMWSAERASPRSEPIVNHRVRIAIDDGEGS